jgi:hypothetical protein
VGLRFKVLGHQPQNPLRLTAKGAPVATVKWDEVTGTYMSAEQYRATYGEPGEVWIDHLPQSGEESDDCAAQAQAPVKSTAP